MCSDGLTEIHTEVSSMPGAWTDYLHHHCYCRFDGASNGEAQNADNGDNDNGN